MALLKRLNVEQIHQKNGLINVGFRSTNDNSYLGTVGEYIDTDVNKRYYTGLLRDKDPLNDKKFVLFDKLELSPFTNDIDFRLAEKADLEVRNLIASGVLTFETTQRINPESAEIINPRNTPSSFEISAVTIADIFTITNQVSASLGTSNLKPSDYFHLLFDNPNIKDQDYVLVKNQNNLTENGIYIVNINSMTDYTSFRRFNDEQSAVNMNLPIEIVITSIDNGKLVRYGLYDPVYYKIKAKLTLDGILEVQFVPFDGLYKTSYREGSWNMDGDIRMTGSLTVNKSITTGESITVGKSFFESVITLSSDFLFDTFNLNIIQAGIYRCNSSYREMFICLPDVSISIGKNIKIIKVDTSMKDVVIRAMPGQKINDTNAEIVLKSKSDHIKLTCDGYEWFTM